MYEPEQFPGAIYKPISEVNVTALIFASGKIVLAGIRSSESIPLLAKEITKEIGLVSDWIIRTTQEFIPFFNIMI